MEDVLSHGNLNRYTSHLPLNTDSSRPAMGYQDDDHLLSGGSAIASGSLLLARRQYDTDPAIEWPHRLFSECGIDGGAVNSMGARRFVRHARQMCAKCAPCESQVQVRFKFM